MVVSNTAAKLSRSKNLSQENVAGGAWHGIDCATIRDFRSLIAEEVRGS